MTFHALFLGHTATRCNTLHVTMTHYNTLQHTTTLQHMQLTACQTYSYRKYVRCNSLQLTATHCKALPHCNTLNTLTHTHIESIGDIPRAVSRPHCTTLQHTATHCNTLQHTTCQTYLYSQYGWYPTRSF